LILHRFIKVAKECYYVEDNKLVDKPAFRQQTKNDPAKSIFTRCGNQVLDGGLGLVWAFPCQVSAVVAEPSRDKVAHKSQEVHQRKNLDFLPAHAWRKLG